MAMANNSSVANKVCLIVIDGWGVSEDPYGNAILNAQTPVMDKLCSGKILFISKLLTQEHFSRQLGSN